MIFNRLKIFLLAGYFMWCPALFSSEIKHVHVTVRDSTKQFDFSGAKPVKVIVTKTKTKTKKTSSVNSAKALDVVKKATVSSAAKTAKVMVATPKAEQTGNQSLIQSKAASSNYVRVLLAKHVSSTTLSSKEDFSVKTESTNYELARGEYLILVYRGHIVLRRSGKAYPLGKNSSITSADSNLFGFQGKLYRGNLRLYSDADRNSYLVNVIPVEEYLRGVVPLEIGQKAPADSAAVQAQAVAARTYTYRKMSDRKSHPFDLLTTVSDQVYGGFSAEYKWSDKAVLSTKDIVMTYTGDFVEAYYHSTCAGKTAAKHEVWGGAKVPYLVSRPDSAANGVVYCSHSPRIRWTETWKLPDFNKIVRQYSRETVGQKTFSDYVSSVMVTGKSESGRVESCIVAGPESTEQYGGDKIRFVFRRPAAGHPILFSSNFTITRSGDEVVAHGCGYGHGIGMCQMGAVGRARSGQSFQTILAAYYTGVKIEKVKKMS